MKRPERRLIVAGILLIGISYGLARFAYGLFLPSMRDDVGLSTATAGFIGSGAYVGYCLAIVASALWVERLGARLVAVIAALVAAGGMAAIAVSTHPLVLAVAILFAGMSTGLASPPMAQAVSGVIDEARQGRANTLINAGTSLGVAVSGPVAFLATGQWRLAYAVFAVAALINALMLWFSVPRRLDASDTPSEADSTTPRTGGLRRPGMFALVLAAIGMGTASAAYWNFASDVVMTLGDFGQNTASGVWVLIGVAGLFGGVAGDLVERLGVNWVHRVWLCAMALSLVLLVLMPTHLMAVGISAALFGAAYIMLTGVYLVWGVGLYADRPAVGLGLPFLMIAVGQVVGSPLAGYLIGSQGSVFCFTTFALIALATALVRHRERHQVSHYPAHPAGKHEVNGNADKARAEVARPGKSSDGTVAASTGSVAPLGRFYLPAMPPLGAIEWIARRLSGSRRVARRRRD
ncbi:MFS transporter [Salinicola aestuarinus]|uniref:MFS transporter n=1 Tax=Salinicola aestuarinus TaxID=1949082 RepID=UPI000DA129C6|nr:MFS transporter [Salinicola aestuarinus]